MTIHLEAEDGTKTGVEVARQRPSFKGTGYVTGFDMNGDQVSFSFVAQDGLYDLRLRYCAANGEKGYEITVNDVTYTGMLPATEQFFVERTLNKVELRKGSNTLVVKKGWGYYDLDWIELITAPDPAALKPLSPALADKRATPKTRGAFAKLVYTYGKVTLSGQYGQPEVAYIKQVTGKSPAIFGADLMDYSPSRKEFGAKPAGLTESLLKRPELLTISWHWNAPTGLLNKKYLDDKGNSIDAMWYKGFNTNATTFDVEKALADKNSDEFRLLLRDIDAIAVELKKLAKVDRPVLWRPLHEAEGGWFWWGAKGPDPLKALWRLLFNRLTTTHQLHNLIWVFNSIKPEWYPGDDVVDIVSVDAYPADTADPLSGSWEGLLNSYDGTKLLALSEFGGVPDVAKMYQFGVRFAYFTSWTGDLGPKKVPAAELKRRYTSPKVRNL
ncbi:MAG: glycosyl hydrolase [Armatimonas sp.]